MCIRSPRDNVLWALGPEHQPFGPPSPSAGTGPAPRAPDPSLHLYNRYVSHEASMKTMEYVKTKKGHEHIFKTHETPEPQTSNEALLILTKVSRAPGE